MTFKNAKKGQIWLIQALSAHSAAELYITTVGGSTFGLWPLFHLRYGGKWTEMTVTQYWGNFKTLISSLHHYKIMLVLFHYFFCFVFCFVFIFILVKGRLHVR
jgi:hypothetical protein